MMVLFTPSYTSCFDECLFEQVGDIQIGCLLAEVGNVYIFALLFENAQHISPLALRGFAAQAEPLKLGKNRIFNTGNPG